MALSDVEALLEQAGQRGGDIKLQKLHDALEKLYECIDNGVSEEDFRRNNPLIAQYLREQLQGDYPREVMVVLQRLQNTLSKLQPTKKSYTLKSLSKGTTTGQFKTVKEAVEAAGFANETKADGTDDWFPEEKGWFDGVTDARPIANSIRDAVRGTIPQFRKLVDAAPVRERAYVEQTMEKLLELTKQLQERASAWDRS